MKKIVITLVGALLIASLFGLNYSVQSTGSLASEPAISTEARANSVNISIEENETVWFMVTTERAPLTGQYSVKIDTEPFSTTEYISPELGPAVLVDHGFARYPPIESFTVNQGEIQKLYLGLNITSGDSGYIGYVPWGESNFTFTLLGVAPALQLLVHRSDGQIYNSSFQWKTDGSTTVEYSIPPIIDVTAPGTYTLDVYYGNQGGPVAWNGYLTLNASWQSLDRPYFYYGLAGLFVALGYIAFVTVGILQKRKSSKTLESVKIENA